MIAKTIGVVFLCGVALGFPSPYPGPIPAPAPAPVPRPGPAPGPYYDGFAYGVGGYGGYGYGCGVEEIITPPVIPPVLNTVDVYDIATLGVIPAPPIEYVYPAVGYEAFGLGGYPEYFREIIAGYPGYGYGGIGYGYDGIGYGGVGIGTGVGGLYY